MADSTAMRRAVIVVALLAACSGPGTTGPTTPNPPGGPTGKRTPVDGGTEAADPAAATPSLALGGASCPTPGCVFHAGTASYFSCLSSGAGACFHYGARCAPADACLYDPASRAYRSCGRPLEGACATAPGAPCTPASACAFNPADGLHHTCESWTSGTCAKWAGLCAP